MHNKNNMKGRNALIGALLALGLSPLAHADQTFTVTTLLDSTDSTPGDGVCLTGLVDNPCSLRAAVQEANLHNGITTINVPVHGIYYLGGADKEDEAVTGDLDVKSRIVINGAGSDVVAIDGLFEDRIFDVHPQSNLTLNDLTIRNGQNKVPPVDQNTIAPTDINQFDGGGGIKVIEAVLELNRVNVTDNAGGGQGGGIDARASNVTINASTISNNFIAGFGGGISNMNGQLKISDSTIANNVHDVQDIIFGGGIFNSGATSSLVIDRTTITKNSAYRDGGGIYHQIGGLLITNSTISENTARRWGGGFFNGNTGPYTVELKHVTIADNEALGNTNESTGGPQTLPVLRGGGFYNRAQENGGGGAVLRLNNSLVAMNGTGGDCYNDTTSNKPAVIISNGSIIGNNTNCRNKNAPGPVTIHSASAISLSSILADNGGPTLTLALGNGSIAINAGDAFYCIDHDQRSFGPRGSSCDSGAYERSVSDFGMPLITAAQPFGGSAVPGGADNPANATPQAFDLLTVVLAGETSVTDQVTVLDFDGPYSDFTSWNILAQDPDALTPSKGTVAWLDDQGAFTYTPDSGASGVDQFEYDVCDGNTCGRGTISVVINNSAVESSVIVKVDPADGTLSPVVVISEADLIATMSNPDFAFPLGAMFFEVTIRDINASSIVVTLELPDGLAVDPNAVVRKMNRFGNWMTLSTTPTSGISWAFFTPAAGGSPATVTLTLVDNDIFDHNLFRGIISDPVALGVATTPTATGGSSTTNTNTNTSTVTSTSTTSAAVADEGGGGIASLGGLTGLLLLSLWRRRRQLNLH